MADPTSGEDGLQQASCEGVRRGRIRCSIRIWTRPHVKVGGRYPIDDGHIVVDSITPMKLRDIARDLAQESGFESVKDLLRVIRRPWPPEHGVDAIASGKPPGRRRRGPDRAFIVAGAAAASASSRAA